ncbi:MAG: acyl-CoA dehydrogenase [Leptospiraceae bacterium]|nr:MAG: acyl-CoA dehydrogenase [Leptospiraceae bacterium]
MESTFIKTQSYNPGLKPYDLTNYSGVRGRNFFLEDQLLKRIFLREIVEQDYSGDHIIAVWKHLEGFGNVAGSILDELTEIAHKEENIGKIIHYNKTGDRIDEVEYCYEQKEIRRICYEWGLVNLDYHPEWKYPFTMFHRMALAYISNMNGEAGVNCPLAMTDGMIRVLKAIGTKSQQETYLPLIADPESKSHFMCGQFVTERVGGSNVAANRTIAKKIEEGDHENPAKYILIGEKWFCSNPGDLWVTTAKIEGTNTIGLFLVPKLLPTGARNSYYLLRRKEIIGSRGKLTAESIYDGTYAEELGKPAHGLANLIKFVINVSRIHVGVSAAGMSRRSLMETFAYIKIRTAYGKKIIDFPQTQLELIKMILKHTTITLANFQNFNLIENNDILSQLLTPMLKYISTITSTFNVRQAILLHGGNGILNDFSCLPRLLNDSIINETWEGAHPVIQDHTIKALKKPRIQQRLELEFESIKNINTDNIPELKNFIDELEKLWHDYKNLLESYLKNEDLLLLNKSYIVEQLFYIYGYYLLLKEIVFNITEEKYKKSYFSFLHSDNPYQNLIEDFSRNDHSLFQHLLNKENLIFRDLLVLYKELGNLFFSLRPVQNNSLFLQKERIRNILNYFGICDF